MPHITQISEFNSNNAITQVNNQLMTTSKVVSDTFGKLHKDVLKKINNLDCSPEFTERNFAPSEFKDNSGKINKCYNMTKDGFMFLVMGFNGKKAASIKEAFINAFNTMEEKLHGQPLIDNVDKQHEQNYLLINNMIAHMKLPDNPVLIPYVQLTNLILSARHVQTSTNNLISACTTMDASITQLKTVSGKSFADF